MSHKRWVIVLLAGALALGLAAVPGFAANKAVGNKPLAEKPFNSKRAMIKAADVYLNSSPAHVISAEDLFAAVKAKDASYQIVDVRPAEHYALGHIDGAINIPFTTIADNASLAKLDSTKKIVVVCYTGETASMTTMVWGMLGYNVRALLFGMSGWVADKSIVGIDIWNGQAAGYPTVTEVPKSTRTFRAPKIEAKYADVAQAIKGQAKVYFGKNLAPIITAADVYRAVQTKDPRYQIVSVRESADYTTGHIKGATNIVWKDIADQMIKLNPKKTIIIYCYTGNLGGESAMFLNLMGYHAYNMMSGMSAWTSDPTVGGFDGYDPSKVPNYPTVK